MTKLDRFAGVLLGAGFILLIVHLFPSAFGVEIPDGSWLYLVGLVLSCVGGFLEMTTRSACRESTQNA